MLSIVFRRLPRHNYGFCSYLFQRGVANVKRIDYQLFMQKPLNIFLLKSIAQDANLVDEYELCGNKFEHICDETLESLCETLEILIESHPEIKGCDITYGDGVLTLTLGENGTYVINRQTPNKQIWLSSPQSGPKRYDFNVKLNSWIYKRDSISLHKLLQEELSKIFKKEIDLSKCSYFSQKQ